jgi:hypothetical protein
MLRRDVGILGVAEGAGVRVDGVAVGIDGPLECRGGRKPDGRGVVVEVSDLVFDINGVIGVNAFFAPPDASEIGGDGGEVCSVDVSDFEGGGVHTDGDEFVVADVEASDIGERGRIVSAVTGLDLCSRYLSIIPSACRSLP